MRSKLRDVISLVLVVVVALSFSGCSSITHQQTAVTPTSTQPLLEHPHINQGGDVFIGEEGLNVTDAVGGFANIAWFASGTNPNTDPPNYIVTVGNLASFSVAPEYYIEKTGEWYRWNGMNQGVAFRVIMPRLDVKDNESW